MAQFDASINLQVNSTAAERQLKKVDKNLEKIENTTRDILGVEKQVIQTRKTLIGLSAQQATKAKNRIKDLSLQKSELTLQRKELQQIARLEKRRQSAVVRTTAGVAATADADGSGAAAGLLAGLSFQKALNRQQQKTVSLGQAQLKVSNKVAEVIEQKTASQEKLNGLIKRVPSLEGNVKRVLNQNNRIKKEGRKLTEGQEKEYIDAKEAVSAINKEIRKLTRETEKLTTEQEKYVNALEKGGKELTKQDSKLKRRQKLASGGKAALAGAAFSNVPGQDIFAAGAAGGLIGSAAGGIGAVPGAAIGASVALVLKLGSALAGLARPAAVAQAELSKLQIALRGVVGTEYPAALDAISRASQDFNQTLYSTTRQFTQLSAAGVANGNTVEQVENLYRGLAAATKATGGSADDLNGVLRAATQVLSKNKVQAEELRGQIGDRLPGAFALFAEATGRTSQELDKALKDGLVSADEFVTDFGNFIRNKYEPAAFLISQSPAEAGARLEKTLKDLQRGIGPILGAIGAEFQIFANEALTAINPLLKELNKFFKLDRQGKNTRLADLEKNKIPEVRDIIVSMAGRDGSSLAAIPKIVAGMFDNPGALRSVDYIFNQAGKKLVEFEARAKQLREELFPTARPQTALPTDPITEDEDTKTKTIKTLLGTDWAKAVGLKESEAQLKLTEMQNDALLAGDRALFDQIEKQRQYTRTLIEIDALTDAIAKAQARLTEYVVDEELLGKANLQIADLKNEKLQREVDLRNQMATAGTTALKDDVDAAIAFGKIVQGAEALEKELTPVEELLNNIGGKLQTGLVDAIGLAVQGTDRLGESFQQLGADILEAVGKALILSAITGGLKALGGGDGVGLFSMLAGALGGNKSTGGPVDGGRGYITGENGPELFIPGSNGFIVPSDPYQAARDVLGSGVESSSGGDAFAENNAAISATAARTESRAIQSENAAYAESMSNDGTIKFESMNIGGMDVVTREEAIAIGQQSAKQARAQVFSDMKNRPATRRQLGMS